MRILSKVSVIFILSVFTFYTSLAQKSTVIPQPLFVEDADGECLISKNTAIITDIENKGNANYLNEMLKPAFRKSLKLKNRGSEGIKLQIDKSLKAELGEEGYTLKVQKKLITISAPTTTGVFYGIQSLVQMLPLDLEKSNGELVVACVTIKDKPRFGWRSFMLDESRYFKGMEQVKKLMDQMALLKMNVFHWHLTDDQGWRIEIKKYPKLTEIGSQRANSQIAGWKSEKYSGVPHGGFYTQKQIKEIVAYAAERNITIVPEIEMPGHSSAAIASYTWLGTAGKDIEVPGKFGRHYDNYDVTKPEVEQFLKDVLTEVFELFPSKVIHIGGDEVGYKVWEDTPHVQQYMKDNNLATPADLQIFFINKISKFIEANGRRMMGWNEIMGKNVHKGFAEKKDDKDAEIELATNVVVHFWKGSLELATEAAEKGYGIVNSLHSSTYLDYGYKNISLKKAYSFEPIPKGLDKKYQANILGSGCQMWGEWIPEVKDMDNQVFPRIAAYAEVGWTAKERKNYKVFRNNLNTVLKRWEKQGIKYADKFE